MGIVKVAQLSTPKTDSTTKDDTKTAPPKRFKVLLLNDDYTTMDFVVAVLEQIFSRKHEDAMRIMLQVHRQGMGVAGVYVKDIAEMKCEIVHNLAGARGFPLHCVMEPE